MWTAVFFGPVTAYDSVRSIFWTWTIADTCDRCVVLVGRDMRDMVRVFPTVRTRCLQMFVPRSSDQGRGV